MQDLIISIALFLFIVIVLRFVMNLLETAKSLRGKDDHENWLKYGLISKKDLYNLDPYEFENWCGEFLQQLGYRDVVVTEEKIDGGKDIVCERDGEKIYVECKKFAYPSISESYQTVSRDIVQKLVGAMVHDRVYNGIIITTGLVSGRAREYIKGLPSVYDIRLIDGEELIRLHRDLREKNIYIRNSDPEIEGLGL